MYDLEKLPYGRVRDAGQSDAMPHALRAGRRATDGWTPDVVFASAPPFTTLIARRTGAPLVIE